VVSIHFKHSPKIEDVPQHGWVQNMDFFPRFLWLSRMGDIPANPLFRLQHILPQCFLVRKMGVYSVSTEEMMFLNNRNVCSGVALFGGINVYAWRSRFPRHKYLDSLRHALASGGPRNSMLLLLLACTKMYQQVVQVVQTLSWSHGKIGKSQMDRFVRTLR
jgi:hypothetical protein